MSWNNFKDYDYYKPLISKRCPSCKSRFSVSPIRKIRVAKIGTVNYVRMSCKPCGLIWFVRVKQVKKHTPERKFDLLPQTVIEAIIKRGG